MNGVATAHIVFAFGAALLRRADGGVVFAVCAASAGLLAAVPRVSFAGITAAAWATVAMVCVHRTPALSALQMVPALGGFYAELDRRELAREIVLAYSAATLACMQAVHTATRVRVDQSHAAQIVDDSIAAQRRSAADVRFYLRSKLPRWPVFACVVLAFNVAAAAAFWHVAADPRVALVFAFLFALAAASTVPAAAAADTELGTSAAEPLIKPTTRGWQWLGAIACACLITGRRSASLMLAWSTHALGALAFHMRSPLVFHVGMLFLGACTCYVNE